MIYIEKVKFKARPYAPKPEECTYWIDLTADPDGKVWKVWTGDDWELMNMGGGSSGGSVDAYTKAESDRKFATNTALQQVSDTVATKQDTLVSNVNIKTINRQSILGSGDIEIAVGLDQDAVETLIGQRLDELVDGAPAAVDTLKELANAINNDPSFATTITNLLSQKLDSATYNSEKANFATKSEIADFITETEADTKYALKSEVGPGEEVDLSGYLTIESASTTYATKSELTSGLAIKLEEDDLDDYVTTDSLTSQLANKLDVTTAQSTYATKSEIAGKQDALISGETIKTVNGQSIMGSGNILIESPEGGLTDAVSDGKLYGRKDGQWSEVVIPKEINEWDFSVLSTDAEERQKFITEAKPSDIVRNVPHNVTDDTLVDCSITSISGDDYKYCCLVNTVIADPYLTILTVSGTDADVSFSYKLSTDYSLDEYSYNPIANKAVYNEIKSITDQIATKLTTSVYEVDKATFALKSEIPDTSDFVSKDGGQMHAGANLTFRSAGGDKFSMNSSGVKTTGINGTGWGVNLSFSSLIFSDNEDEPGKGARYDAYGVEIYDKTENDLLHAGGGTTKLKTINSQSLLGEGNIEITSGTGGITDAPSDGSLYARKDNIWQKIKDSLFIVTEHLTSNPTDQELYNQVKQAIQNQIPIYAVTNEPFTDENEAHYIPASAEFNVAVGDDDYRKVILNYTLSSTDGTTSYLGVHTVKISSNGQVDYKYQNNAFATKVYVDNKVSELVNSAPEALDTLNELAAALGNDANFSTTITTALGNKVDSSVYTADKATFALKTDLTSKMDVAGGEFTGTVAVPTLALMYQGQGMMFQIQSSQRETTFRTYNAGQNTINFQIQNSTPLKLTEAGIWENGVLLENKYVLNDDLTADLSSYLTISTAESTYAKKTDIPSDYVTSSSIAALIARINTLESQVAELETALTCETIDDNHQLG